MRTIATALAVALLVPACESYSDDHHATLVDPVAQCRTLVDLYCVAAEVCGWDENAGPCREYVGEACDRNLTIVSPQTFATAQLRLTEYECAPNEAFITWANDQGRYALDAMLAWPESPASD